MSRFAELGTIKNAIMTELLSDTNIVKCLVNNEPDFLSQPLPSDVNDLIGTQVFPYRYIPDLKINPSTFITMKFSYKSSGVTFKVGSIYFYIITHQSILDTDYRMLRYDYLVNQIDEVFNQNNDLGIGAMTFFDMDEFTVDKEGKWLGSFIAYKNVDFQ